MHSCKPARLGKILRVVLLVTIGVGLTFGLYQWTDILLDKLPVRRRLESPNHQRVDTSTLAEVSKNMTSNVLVPNIVHYIWFGERHEFSFLNYLSVLSAYNVQHPDLLLLHCGHVPVGEWWNRTQQQVPIQTVYVKRPAEIHGQKLKDVFHQGDVAKLEILMKYGGIYLDTDVLVTKSLDPLRQYPMTMGKERGPRLNAGVIIAHCDSQFLKLVYESYRDNYRGWDWDYNCARIPYIKSTG